MAHKLGWGFFLLLTFIVTLPLSWWLLAKVDFAYPVLYDNIGIPTHIERYAPRNNQGKHHFELSSRAERVDLFHQVVLQIRSDKPDLASLSYQDKVTNKTIQLFTNAEIIHLEDVANLLNKLRIIVLLLLLIWLITWLILWQRKMALPSTKQLLISAVSILVIFSLLLLLGPEAIFNQLHVWVFPDNHQWFFYYEESLMSTMMKAPDLFAYIAAEMALASLFLTFILIRFSMLFFKRDS